MKKIDFFSKTPIFFRDFFIIFSTVLISFRPLRAMKFFDALPVREKSLREEKKKSVIDCQWTDFFEGWGGGIRTHA
ncbi:MAG: hypothetical protein IKE16_05075 [Solobacterium sp.]|nr:hypothetical protein [Solobacterium sp.]